MMSIHCHVIKGDLDTETLMTDEPRRSIRPSLLAPRDSALKRPRMSKGNGLLEQR